MPRGGGDREASSPLSPHRCRCGRAGYAESDKVEDTCKIHAFKLFVQIVYERLLSKRIG